MAKRPGKPAGDKAWQKKKARTAAKKTARPIHLARSKRNPILEPRPENGWEAQQTFNPGAVSLDGNVHLLYRAIGADGISRLGYAVSRDGFTVDERLPYPVYEHLALERTFAVYSYLSGGSWGGSEDPRLVRVGEEDVLYMTYTACNQGLRVGLTSITVDHFLRRQWKKWRRPTLISPQGETHKNWVIFPEKIRGKYAILHSITPTIQIAYVDGLNNIDPIKSVHGSGPQKGRWDIWLRGAAAPPLKTRDGWLLLYHAMDDDWSRYKVGAMLLDPDDPTHILFRAKEPILIPEKCYELHGHKPGVVYVSGAVVKDGNLLVYYGCSDTYVGVAYTNLDAFLEALKRGTPPKLIAASPVSYHADGTI